MKSFPGNWNRIWRKRPGIGPSPRPVCVPPPCLKNCGLFEEYGLRGASAHAFLAAEERYKNDLGSIEREVLLAVLVCAKTRLKTDRAEFHFAISSFSGIPLSLIEPAVHDLMTEYGVLEWNDRFARYEIIGDAVPRTEFSKFLKQKTAMFTMERIEELFTAHMKNWAELPEPTPAFASANEIFSNEWRFHVECTHLRRLEVTIKNAVQDWKNAIQVDMPRGKILYCYLPPDADPGQLQKTVAKILVAVSTAEKCEEGVSLRWFRYCERQCRQRLPGHRD